MSGNGVTVKIEEKSWSVNHIKIKMSAGAFNFNFAVMRDDEQSTSVKIAEVLFCVV